MSKKSPDKKPYYLRYGEPAWYRDQVKFPEGRDPRRDLFSRDAVMGIMKSVTRANSVDADELQRDLRNVAISFLTGTLTTPLGMNEGPAKKTHHQRTRWLRGQIVNPARTLLDALSDENAPMLSEWPETMNATAPDGAALCTELRKLIDRADELIAVLDDRKRDGTGFATEFRTDLANALTRVFEKHFPDLKAARDGYDKTTAAKSPYAEFLRLCTEEIFPNDPALSGRIIDDISKMRGNR